ncbi:MAG: DMT family transporter, partial [bacterium]
MIDKKYLPHAVFLMLCLIWGSTWVVIKIGLQEAPPFLSAGARFLIAVLLLYALMKIRGLKLPKDRRALMLMIYTGTFAVSLAYGLVYWAEQHVAAGLTAVLFSSFPFFVIIYSHFMIANDRLTKMKIIGSCIGFGGVVLIYLDSLRIDNVFVLVGASAIVVSAICTAFSNVVIKKNFDILDPVVLSVVQMTCGAVTLLAIGFIFEDPANFRLTLTSLASLFCLAVV